MGKRLSDVSADNSATWGMVGRALRRKVEIPPEIVESPRVRVQGVEPARRGALARWAGHKIMAVLTVRLPEGLASLVERLALRWGCSKAQVVRTALIGLEAQHRTEFR